MHLRAALRRRAFSLLELLICIAIIALLASILLSVAVKVLQYARSVAAQVNG